MSRSGNSYNNAPMESFYKSLKTELLVNGRFEAIEMIYNTKRLHSSLGYILPNQFEDQF